MPNSIMPAPFSNAERLRFYLMNRGEGNRNRLIEMEMRVLDGDCPSYEEWIEAIDATMREVGLTPAISEQENVTMEELMAEFTNASGLILRQQSLEYGIHAVLDRIRLDAPERDALLKIDELAHRKEAPMPYKTICLDDDEDPCVELDSWAEQGYRLVTAAPFVEEDKTRKIRYVMECNSSSRK